jgi:hypothetical protein
MENPYRPSNIVPVEASGKPPFRERLALGLIFAFCAFPLITTVLFYLIEEIPSGEHTYYRIIGPGSDRVWFGILASIVLFIAGLALIYRRRLAVGLFWLSLIALTIANLVIGWRNDRIIGLVLVASFLAYALVLRKRGRLR